MKSPARTLIRKKSKGGRPPVSGRFKPGQSGNPSGRPRGRKNLATLFREASGQTFEAVINGKKRKITALQSAIFQMASAAAKGDQRAIVNFVNYMDEFERRAMDSQSQPYPFSEVDQAMIKSVYDRMLKCNPPSED